MSADNPKQPSAESRDLARKGADLMADKMDQDGYLIDSIVEVFTSLIDAYTASLRAESDARLAAFAKLAAAGIRCVRHVDEPEPWCLTCYTALDEQNKISILPNAAADLQLRIERAEAAYAEAEWWFSHQLCHTEFVARLTDLESQLASLKDERRKALEAGK